MTDPSFAAPIQVTGDVSSLPLGAQIVTAIQGRPVSGVAPAAGQDLRWDGTSKQWLPQYPPGYKFAYAEFTGIVNATSSLSTSAVTVVSAGAVTFDGSTEVKIDFFTPEWTASDNSAGIKLCVFDGSTSSPVGTIFQAGSVSGANTPNQGGFTATRTMTPAAGAHTYFVGITDAGAVTTVHARVVAGTGGTNLAPGFIRITKT